MSSPEDTVQPGTGLQQTYSILIKAKPNQQNQTKPGNNKAFGASKKEGFSQNHIVPTEIRREKNVASRQKMEFYLNYM